MVSQGVDWRLTTSWPWLHPESSACLVTLLARLVVQNLHCVSWSICPGPRCLGFLSKGLQASRARVALHVYEALLPPKSWREAGSPQGSSDTSLWGQMSQSLHQASHLKSRARPQWKSNPCPSDLKTASPVYPERCGFDTGVTLKMCLGDKGALSRGEKILTRTQPWFQMVIHYFISAFAKVHKNTHNIYIFFPLASSVTANAIMISNASVQMLLLYIFLISCIVVNEIKHTHHICLQGTRNWTHHWLIVLLKWIEDSPLGMILAPLVHQEPRDSLGTRLSWGAGI